MFIPGLVCVRRNHLVLIRLHKDMSVRFRTIGLEEFQLVQFERPMYLPRVHGVLNQLSKTLA